MLVCGFVGIGKSIVARSIPNYVNLEDDYGDLDDYIKNALILDKTNQIVLLNCDKALRKELMNKKIPFVTILPLKELKDEYIEKFTKERKGKKFIKDLKDNWNEYVAALNNEPVLRLESQEFLYDVIWKIDTIAFKLNGEEKVKIMEKLVRNEEKRSLKETMMSSGFSASAPERVSKVITKVVPGEDLEDIGMNKLGENSTEEDVSK